MAASAETGRLIDKEQNAKSVSNLVKVGGFCLVVMARALNAIGSGCAQALGGAVPGFQRNLWRFGVQAAYAGLLVVVLKVCFRVPTERLSVPREQIVYVILIGIAFNVFSWTYFGADPYLPTGVVGSMEVVTELLLASVISTIVLRKLPLHVAVATVLCITGAVLVMQPTFIFKGGKQVMRHPPCRAHRHPANQSVALQALNTSRSEWDADPNSTRMWGNISRTDPEMLEEGITGGEVLGYIQVVIAAISFLSYITIINKKLSNIDSSILVLWVGVLGTLFSLVGMAVSEEPTFPEGELCQWVLIVHAVTSTAAVSCATPGAKVVPPVMFALVMTSQIVFMTIAQYTVLASINPGHRNAAEVIGVACVIVGNLVGPVYAIIKDWNQPDAETAATPAENNQHELEEKK